MVSSSLVVCMLVSCVVVGLVLLVCRKSFSVVWCLSLFSSVVSVSVS